MIRRPQPAGAGDSMNRESCHPLRGLIRFLGLNMGFRFAPPQGGVPGRAARLGCETLRFRPRRGLRMVPRDDQLQGMVRFCV